MKKLLALLIALTLAFALALPALAEASPTEAAAAEETVDAAEDIAEETADAAVEEAAAAEETVDAAEDVAEETVDAAVEEAAEVAVEEAADEPQVSPVFKKLIEQPWYVYAILAALVIAAVILLTSGRKVRWDSRRIAMGAMCIAIAFVLSNIRLFRMPQGGSITPASMLPLVLFMLACGPLQGLVVGIAYGLLQLIADPYVIHPIQLLVDYPLAFGAMILCCAAARMPLKKPWRLPVAVLLAGIGRYVMAVLSGSIFFAEYAGEQNAWLYSLGYNLSYLGPDTLVCMIVACVPGMSRLVDVIRKR